jgi:hypothetical protein
MKNTNELLVVPVNNDYNLNNIEFENSGSMSRLEHLLSKMQTVWEALQELDFDCWARSSETSYTKWIEFCRLLEQREVLAESERNRDSIRQFSDYFEDFNHYHSHHYDRLNWPERFNDLKKKIGKEIAQEMWKSITNIQKRAHSDCNIIPGSVATACHPTLVVMSIQHPFLKESKKEITLETALQKIVKHCIGECRNTQKVVLIVSQWEDRVFQQWRKTLEQIALQTPIYLEIVGLGRKRLF